MAQDVIVKVNGEKVDCTIISVTDNQVAYKISGDIHTKYLGKTYVKEIVYGQKNETKPETEIPKETIVENKIIDVELVLASKEPAANTEKSEKDTCDNIILRSGEEISSKVIEVGVTEIKYRKCPKVSGPLYSVLKSDVFMIQYSNGKKDIMPEEKVVQKKNEEEPVTWQPKPMAEEKSKFKNYTTFGVYMWDSFDEVLSWNINSSVHFQPIYFFSVGIGSGLFFRKPYYNYYYDEKKTLVYLPLVGELKFLFSKHRFSPIIAFSGGYLFSLSKGPEDPYGYYGGNYKELGGATFNAELGFRILNYNRLGLVFSISYVINHMGYRRTYNGQDHDNKIDNRFLGINVGITF